jgi:hypothetical protein
MVFAGSRECCYDWMGRYIGLVCKWFGSSLSCDVAASSNAVDAAFEGSNARGRVNFQLPAVGEPQASPDARALALRYSHHPPRYPLVPLPSYGM